jgi:hypothetical protein
MMRRRGPGGIEDTISASERARRTGGTGQTDQGAAAQTGRGPMDYDKRR